MSYRTSEKLRRIFNQHHILVHLKPTNTLRLKVLHPEDKTPRHTQSNVVYSVQCSQDCTDLYIGETIQPLHKRMAQHRKANSSGQDSAVHLHLKKKNHSLNPRHLMLPELFHSNGPSIPSVTDYYQNGNNYSNNSYNSIAKNSQSKISDSRLCLISITCVMWRAQGSFFHSDYYCGHT